MEKIVCEDCGINNNAEQQYCQNCGIILRPLSLEIGGHFRSGFELSQWEEANEPDY